LYKKWIVEQGIYSSISDFIEYFESVYIGIYDKNNILLKPPMYPIKFWNAFDRVKGGIPRTTNALEG
jgi:hypothetical protein